MIYPLNGVDRHEDEGITSGSAHLFKGMGLVWFVISLAVGIISVFLATLMQ